MLSLFKKSSPGLYNMMVLNTKTLAPTTRMFFGAKNQDTTIPGKEKQKFKTAKGDVVSRNIDKDSCDQMQNDGGLGGMNSSTHGSPRDELSGVEKKVKVATKK